MIYGTIAPKHHAHMNERMNEVTAWITVKEAADVLDLTQHAVRHLCRTEKLAARRFGKAWMISRESVEHYQRGIGGRPRKLD